MMGREISMCDRDEEYVTKFKYKKTVKYKHIGRPRQSVKDDIKVHFQ
jgi:hypothetical protein